MTKRLGLTLAMLIATVTMVGVAQAATTPSPHDPCAQAGRDSCGTTGAGAYHNYSFGLRWFGDYRNAVPGISGATLCIDLNYWYPGRAYDYKQRSIANLRSRQGNSVSATALHEMAYAIWTYGRTNNPNQQAATMLYVHGLVPGTPVAQVAPNSIGPAVGSIVHTISTASSRYAGPYTIDATLPAKATAGIPAKLTLRLRAASGAGVPNVKFGLQISGAAGAPGSVTSGSSGIATVTLTPDDVARGLHVKASAAGLASNLPLLFVPTKGAAVRNGQRLIGPSSQSVSATASASVALARPRVTSKATPAAISVGATNADQVTITGLPASYRPKVQVQLFGPAASAAAISCSATPVATTSFTARNGTTTAPALTPAAPGYYGYRITIPGSDQVAAANTACAPAGETFEVTTTPAVHTQVSAATAAPGVSLYDTVAVTGLSGQTATVTANLYGPYASASAITCKSAPIWSGQLTATGDGTYQTQPTTLTTPGYYVYVESIAAQGFVKPAATTCATAAETTIVLGSPTVQTEVSDQTTAPGSKLTDQAVVSGLGALSATVNVSLWGPYDSKAQINCSGKPAWTGSLTANGDGTYTTAPATLAAAGYYVYQESIAPTAAYPGVATACADTSETSFAHAVPTVGTQASSAAVVPGSQIHDQIKVSGLGSTPATIKVQLYGPFASRSQIRCSGRPAWQGSVAATGDGSYSSPATVIAKVGFYVYHESLAASPLYAAVNTPCSSAPETSLGIPQIITGGDSPVFAAEQPAASKPASSIPATVAIPRLGINAPISPGPISLRTGDLVVPSDIHDAGWWQDGAAPGDQTGTTLLAGHIDHAGQGPGAFYQLAQAGDGKINVKGMIVTVTTRAGKSYRYRIVSVQRMLKSKLPTQIFTQTGARKLVLVTCGGPFNYKTRHYFDNVVVTAVPA